MHIARRNQLASAIFDLCFGLACRAIVEIYLDVFFPGSVVYRWKEYKEVHDQDEGPALPAEGAPDDVVLHGAEGALDNVVLHGACAGHTVRGRHARLVRRRAEMSGSGP